MKYISRKEAKARKFKGNIEENNQKFIDESLINLKDYFDKMFRHVDENIVLDDEQRKAILTDEDYNLIIAGAGSGKTTTLAAKVKYLVEIKNIKPEQILIISFTNKAVDELKERINDQFRIPAKICTFHKFGVDVLKERKINFKIANPYEIVKKYFDEELVLNREELKKFINFFGSYLNISKSSLLFDYLESYHQYKRKVRFVTVNEKVNNGLFTMDGKKVDNYEHLLISNFLYLNSINYTYRTSPLAAFTVHYGKKKINIEPFGVLLSHPNNIIDNLNKKIYESDIKMVKINHKLNRIPYIELHSGKDMLINLKNELNKHGIELKKRDEKEVYMYLTKSKEIYFSNFISFCISFIQKLKIKEINLNDLKNKTNDKRNLMFLDIIEEVYDYYNNYLEENGLYDFEDIITKSANKLKKLKYKYIIIDEYQDISKQRFNLAQKISSASNAKLIAVGDDWQSIFAFSGSEIDLFVDFEKKMGYCSKLSITNTYRNSQELIDIAGKFIMKNDFQIKKKLNSNKHLVNPVIVCCYDDINNKFKNRNKVLKTILNNASTTDKILLLGRYNFEKNYLLKDKDFTCEGNKIVYRKRPLDITFLSVHSSKGLGFDQVIVLNMEDDVYGFPSKITNDPIMKLLDDDKNHIEEERRLFYVALTRTKNYVYLITPVNSPSCFVKELLDYKQIKIINKTSSKLKS